MAQLPAREIYVFVSSLPDLQTLLSAVPDGGETLILDGDQDGVLQLADALSGESGLDAIHIFSHGSVGSLYLGSAVLDLGSLSRYSQALGQIGGALGDSGDLLLYGCDVAKGDVGGQFALNLAAYTAADVAASSDTTGSGSGGNWTVEVATGHHNRWKR